VCWLRHGRQTLEGPLGGALYGGTDGPRPGAGATRPLHTSGRSAMAQRVFFFAADLDLTFREGPRRGGEIVGCVLASVGHPRRLWSM
jgi:hypothetical protein